jgi:hypothetical protein
VSAIPIIRSQYWNPSTGTVRGGSTAHGESLVDMESGVLPLARATASSLHTWGVADGLTVSAVTGADGVTVAPGVGLDALGRVVVLANGGVAVIDPAADPAQVLNVPTVPVGPDGVVLPTAGTAAGAWLVTLTFREVQDEGQLSGAPVLLLAPWVRLQASADVPDDGHQLVLGTVTLDASGLVTALDATRRRLSGLPTARVELRRPVAADGATPSTAQEVGAVLAVPDSGGLSLSATTAGPDVPVLTVDAALQTLTLVPGGGSVGIGLSGAAQRSLHVQGSEIHSGGPGAGFSFSDRNAASFVEVPGAGERWVWYSLDGTARLWSGADVLSVGQTGQAGVVRLQLPSPGNSLEVSAAEGTIGTLALSADTVTVRRADGSQPLIVDGAAGRVGVGTDSPTHRLHVAGSSGLRQNETYLSGGPGWSSLTYNAFHNDANNGWVFPDPTRSAVTIEMDDAGGTPRFQVWATPTSNTQTFQQRFTIDGNTGVVTVPGMLSVNGSGVGDQGATLSLQNDNAKANAFCATTRGGTALQAAGKDKALTAFGPSSFIGNVDVSGTLTASNKQFLIDHPVDPDNRVLVHASVESSERLVTYCGNATCDDAGEARVQLPDWLEPLATDFRFQLTCIGAHAPVYVAGEMRDGAFVIAGGTTGLRVSWQVTGVRHDAWALANLLEVELDKPESERGFYHNPEAFGQTMTSSVHWPRNLGLVEQHPATVHAFVQARAEHETARRAEQDHRIEARARSRDTP